MTFKNKTNFESEIKSQNKNKIEKLVKPKILKLN